MKTTTYPEAGQAPSLVVTTSPVEETVCGHICDRMAAAVTVRQLRRACAGTVWVIWTQQSIERMTAARTEAKARIAGLRTVRTRAARRQLERAVA